MSVKEKLSNAWNWTKNHKKEIAGILVGATGLTAGVVHVRNNYIFEITPDDGDVNRIETTGWSIGGNPNKGDHIDFGITAPDKELPFFKGYIGGKNYYHRFTKEQAEELVDTINYYLGKGNDAPDVEMMKF